MFKYPVWLQPKSWSCVLLCFLSLFLLVSSVPSPSGANLSVQPMLLAMAQQHPDQTIGIIIQTRKQRSILADKIASLGGEITHELKMINAVAARLPARSVAELAHLDEVRWVSLNAPIAKAGDNHLNPTAIIHEGFDQPSYQSGDSQWPSAWIEIGENDGPETGNVVITNFLGGTRQGLRLQNMDSGIQSKLNLSHADQAVLTLSYRRKGFDDTSDAVAVQISADNGLTWTELDYLSGPGSDIDVQQVSYDISPYASDQTIIRLVCSTYIEGDSKFYVDHIQVAYSSIQRAQPELLFNTYLPMISAQGDQSVGEEQQIKAASLAAGETVRDEFNAISYTNNDGTQDWLGSWVEFDDSGGPSGGDIKIVNDSGGLRLQIHGKDGGIWRTSDLLGATWATLSLDYRRKKLKKSDEYAAVEISDDGGVNWIELGRFAGPDNDTNFQSASYDISSYISNNMAIRFISSSMNGSHKVFLDNIQIEYGCTPCIGTANLSSTYIQSIGAAQLWNEPPYLQGQNIGVAVVDTGIAPHDDLRDEANNSRVVAQVHFNTIPGSLDDSYGHGSHVAGSIGGNGTKSNGGYMGVAPKVNLIDVQIADDLGVGTVADLIAGLEWVYDNKDTYNIRVVNLSLSSTIPESYLTSPLSAAVEVLWFNSIVVVVSVGNNGDNSGLIYPPANDPFVLTVGATDDQGTVDINDDVLAPYSDYGITTDGFAKPDLVAPGTNIISLLAADDTNLALAHPAHAIAGPDGNSYFRMTGTSMASAVTAGAVALLLQDEPTLTPDQVKHRLMATAHPFSGPQPGSTGAGYLDIYAAVHGMTTASENAGIVPNQLVQGGGAPGHWNNIDWNTLSWDTLSWDTLSWDTLSWDSVHWDD